ncbi:RagB/SusD family nutrient uptake outer membrane protein [Algoriphagus halophytocola]|uniref:RagB/SusD family nutrient uptake outer membrane protein n=1 Tax=Algoriphagus halophytocola TaxID=2991499 RepID=A0ABY6MMB6_9BACT|nr:MULTISPECIES: RagB/SusD family nutrient uptake outer membrane protein [unclassified Algoriphagus]UZD23821.1 RagB/SusD family nutrient uptake outer membrane protein [Algoriphagus sp. TR-M5]WBL41188.1 RagB/SusD family nutrient uptake outer membrane protein [Algoriphagus sp. TR-M9]
MKTNTKFHKLILGATLLLGGMAGCSEDFLDRPPLDAIVDANFYQNDDQILAASAPLYNIVWFAYNDKASHGIGDARGGVLTSGSYQLENVRFNTTGETGENGASWRAFYNVVAQSNSLINNINAFAGEEVTERIKNYGISEGRFMRGLAYSYLVQNWGPVPIITNNTALLQDTTIARNTEESVWQFIIKDFRFAAENLTESPALNGRLTKWSAEGMLAKMYLVRAGVGGTRNQTYLDSAAYYAKRVIDNSGASLMENYEDLFKTQNNNNQETLAALQWVYNAGQAGQWGAQNSVQAFLAYGSEITGFGDGWGGDIGASKWMLDLYDDLVFDERRKGTFMFPGDHYPYITQVPAGGSAQELRVPAQNTDGTRDFNGRAWVKKYVVGRPEDNDGKVVQQGTEINTYILRLADVYLTYAEAVLNTNPAEALKYVNMVRERAGVSPLSSVTWEDIFEERIKEFAMEGQAWYEFTKLHYYDPQRAYDILSNQDRGTFRIYADQIPDPTLWEIEIPEDDTSPRFFDVNESNFLIPIPSAELSRAPNLRKPPVPYDFSSEN